MGLVVQLIFRGSSTSPTTASSRSSDWVGGGVKKHEIYVAAFSSHLFYDLFLQGWRAMAPLAPWICY